MDFKDYYATLGVDAKASPELIKRAYRKLARKYHPDVSKEPDAENRFKEVAEAHEALIDPERRAAYDDLALRHAQRGTAGAGFAPPPGWDSGYEFSGPGGGGGGNNGAAGGSDEAFSAFFESLFGRGGAQGPGPRRPHASTASAGPLPGADHHAHILIALADAYRGAHHSITLRRPVADAAGVLQMQQREVEVNIPRGVRPGQHLRLAGLGEAGQRGGAAGDLYLEIGFRPDARFRLDGADVWLDLALAPWEAALGATITTPTPEGDVELGIPAGSGAGRKLRLKGRGLPGKQPGDLYAVLQIALPPADSAEARAAYAAMAQAFAAFNPRNAQPANAP